MIVVARHTPLPDRTRRLPIKRIAFVAVLLVPAAALNRSYDAPQTRNSVPLIMKTPRSGFNRMVVSVALCTPGTDRCATIDDVMVDTGSTGLRIEASAMPTTLRLPPFLGPNHAPLGECLRFIHDTAWGPLVRADLRLGGLTAPDVPIQVIADGPSQPPEGCPASDVSPTSNGTLGIGPRLLDCPGDCDQVARTPDFFSLERGSWVPVRERIAPAFRLPNPVSRFPTHNNGIVIDLPAPRHGGEAEVTGTLTFGVGTAANNQLGGGQILRVDRRGFFTTRYGGRTYPDSYLDSGTMTYVVGSDDIRRCARMTWAFCVDPSRDFAAMMIDGAGDMVATSFKVGDYQSIGDHRFGAADGAAIAGDNGTTSFVWGAPYFLGRRIALVFERMSVPGVASALGPSFAIEPHKSALVEP